MFRLARESIQMQSSLFFDELVLAFSNFKEVDTKGIETSREVEILEAVIKKHTNLKVDFDLGMSGPAVMVPQVTKNHPLVSSWRRQYVNNIPYIKLANQVKELRGSVNLKTGKVSGFFLDLPVTIYFPTDIIKDVRGSDFSNEEKAAMLLHEIGHVVTYFEYIARSVSTNQILAGMSRELSNAETDEERETILVTTKTALGVDTLNLPELKKSRENKVIEAVVMAAVIEETRAELGNNIYDSTCWEALSDDYAARYGANAYLVTSLEKIYRRSGNISTRGAMTYLAYEAFKLVFLLASITPLAPFALPVSLLLFLADGANAEYDTPEARMIRVKSQLVSRLKDKSLTKEEIENITDDLNLIERVLKDIDDKRQFITVLWDFMIPSARRDRNFTKLQQDLEIIANNDLFVKAAEFKLAVSSK